MLRYQDGNYQTQAHEIIATEKYHRLRLGWSQVETVTDVADI